jgi:type IV secretory pathway VirB10-like protein
MVAKTETLGRGARLTLVAGIHVAVAYAIMASLGVVKPVVFTEPMSARVIDAPAETQPLDPVVPEEPQLTEPTLTEPTPVEVPQIPTEVEAPPAPAAITTSPSEPVETAQMQVTNRVEPVAWAKRVQERSAFSSTSEVAPRRLRFCRAVDLLASIRPLWTLSNAGASNPLYVTVSRFLPGPACP